MSIKFRPRMKHQIKEVGNSLRGHMPFWQKLKARLSTVLIVPIYMSIGDLRPHIS